MLACCALSSPASEEALRPPPVTDLASWPMASWPARPTIEEVAAAGRPACFPMAPVRPLSALSPRSEVSEPSPPFMKSAPVAPPIIEARSPIALVSVFDTASNRARAPTSEEALLPMAPSTAGMAAASADFAVLLLMPSEAASLSRIAGAIMLRMVVTMFMLFPFSCRADLVARN